MLGAQGMDSQHVARFDENDHAGMEALCAVFMEALAA